MKHSKFSDAIGLLPLLVLFLFISCSIDQKMQLQSEETNLFQASEITAFPAVIPLQKPDRPLSAAMQRMYDRWHPHEDRANELYSNFKYSRLTGFDYPKSTSRRDPSKVLKIDGKYYVWYTRRHTKEYPVWPPDTSDEENPSADWDLAEIWFATSNNGFDWKEEGVAISTPDKPTYG